MWRRAPHISPAFPGEPILQSWVKVIEVMGLQGLHLCLSLESLTVALWLLTVGIWCTEFFQPSKSLFQSCVLLVSFVHEHDVRTKPFFYDKVPLCVIVCVLTQTLLIQRCQDVFWHRYRSPGGSNDSASSRPGLYHTLHCIHIVPVHSKLPVILKT